MGADTESATFTAFSEVFAAEQAAIAPSAELNQTPSRPLTGLAFSGGGIRSATFNLGVIQALSELKLLRHFDYLSTVSGGGFIGGWLSAYIQRCAHGDVKEAEEHLHSGGQEADAVRFLRSYSNYLTPRMGVFSADTLTAVATYVRNLYLNLAVLLLYLGGALLLPRILVWCARWLAGWEGAQATAAGHTGPLFALAGLCLVIAMMFIGLNLGGGVTKRETAPFYACQGWILALIVVPIMLSAWFLGYGLYVGSKAFTAITTWEWMLWGVLAYMAPWCIGWFLGRWKNRGDPAQIHFSMPRIVMMGFYALAAAMLGGCLLSLFASAADRLHPFGYSASWFISALGAALMLKIYSLTVVAHIGLMGRDFSHESREWWSRLGGWLLLFALIWAAVFSIVFVAPAFFKWAALWLLGSGGAAWLSATVSGVLLGRSANTGVPGKKNWRDRVAVVAPYIFIIGLLGLIAWGLQELLVYFFCPDCIAVEIPDDASFFDILLLEAGLFKAIAPHTLVLLALSSAIAATLLALRVDVNLFSIYYFYRQRLARCYLGATRCKKRAPHPFTGFDPQDDLRLAELCRVENGRSVCQRPYPILNTALNMVHGKQLAWQERRAAAFAFSPLYCGYDFQLPDEKGERVSCYRPSAEYMQRVHLGSAITISGAAASPNMGYHSSPALTLLMTVFNVRLGHWSGNPSHAQAWRRYGPYFGGKYLLKELFGQTDYDSPYVYLSDGGHFENLAIYELVRRRCQCILVVDAGEDGKNTFDDLGNAIRKCYADFGVVIDMRVDNLKRKPDRHVDGYYAVGEIRYPGAAPGTLIYVKPGLTGEEPADLLNYARTHPDFPHQPTSDQWFDESQFESYRKLGHWIGKSVLGAPLIKARQQSGAAPDTAQLLLELCAALRAGAAAK